MLRVIAKNPLQRSYNSLLQRFSCIQLNTLNKDPDDEIKLTKKLENPNELAKYLIKNIPDSKLEDYHKRLQAIREFPDLKSSFIEKIKLERESINAKTEKSPLDLHIDWFSEWLLKALGDIKVDPVAPKRKSEPTSIESDRIPLEWLFPVKFEACNKKTEIRMKADIAAVIFMILSPKSTPFRDFISRKTKSMDYVEPEATEFNTYRTAVHQGTYLYQHFDIPRLLEICRILEKYESKEINVDLLCDELMLVCGLDMEYMVPILRQMEIILSPAQKSMIEKKRINKNVLFNNLKQDFHLFIFPKRDEEEEEELDEIEEHPTQRKANSKSDNKPTESDKDNKQIVYNTKVKNIPVHHFSAYKDHIFEVKLHCIPRDAANIERVDSFVFTKSDPKSATLEANYDISINPVNEVQVGETSNNEIIAHLKLTSTLDDKTSDRFVSKLNPNTPIQFIEFERRSKVYIDEEKANAELAPYGPAEDSMDFLLQQLRMKKSRKLLIDHLPQDIKVEDIVKALSSAGKVSHCYLYKAGSFDKTMKNVKSSIASNKKYKKVDKPVKVPNSRVGKIADPTYDELMGSVDLKNKDQLYPQYKDFNINTKAIAKLQAKEFEDQRIIAEDEDEEEVEEVEAAEEYDNYSVNESEFEEEEEEEDRALEGGGYAPDGTACHTENLNLRKNTLKVDYEALIEEDSKSKKKAKSKKITTFEDDDEDDDIDDEDEDDKKKKKSKKNNKLEENDEESEDDEDDDDEDEDEDDEADEEGIKDLEVPTNDKKNKNKKKKMGVKTHLKHQLLAAKPSYNYAVIVMDDDVGYNRLTSEPIRLFGLYIKDGVSRVRDMQPYNTFLVEVLKITKLKEVLSVLDVQLNSQYNIALKNLYGLDKKPFFLSLTFATHEEAWIAFQSLYKFVIDNNEPLFTPFWIRPKHHYALQASVRNYLNTYEVDYEFIKGSEGQDETESSEELLQLKNPKQVAHDIGIDPIDK